MKKLHNCGVKHFCFTPQLWSKAFLLYSYRTARSHRDHCDPRSDPAPGPQFRP